MQNTIEVYGAISCGVPPWENAPHGVVSLLDMLEFSARDYLEISYNLGQIKVLVRDDPTKDVPSERISESFRNLFQGCRHLNLVVTKEHVDNMFEEFATVENGKIVVREGVSLAERLAHHTETIYSVLRAELGSLKIKAIPREKGVYCDPEWLVDSLLYQKFPETVDEFQRAGRCFAFGENTACVFHLMRVTDFCLRKVADSIRASYDARNWQGIGHTITKNMEQKYQTKTDDWKQKEPFYAEILTDIQAISRGHRNPALHELEKKYEEREAHYMLTVIEGFATHVASNL